MSKRLLGGLVPTILALACAEPAPQGQSVSGSEIGATAESVTYVEATPAVTNTLRASGQSGLLGAPPLSANLGETRNE